MIAHFVREILSITNITIIETVETGWGARFELTVPQGSFTHIVKAPLIMSVECLAAWRRVYPGTSYGDSCSFTNLRFWRSRGIPGYCPRDHAQCETGRNKEEPCPALFQSLTDNGDGERRAS